MTIVSEVKSNKNSATFREIKIHGSDGKVYEAVNILFSLIR